MIKVAFFVEGQTERIFIKKFLTLLLEDKVVNIQEFRDRITLLKALRKDNNSEAYYEYSFAIYEVGGNDESVVSSICEDGKILLNEKGYDKIFGICDLYIPKRKLNDKSKVLKALDKKLKRDFDCSSKISIILAIMEIEAWFLADYNLFSKIDSVLSPEYIKKKLEKKKNLKIDLIKDDPEEKYPAPASLINAIYELIGRKYKKHKDDAYEITHRIDYDYLYLETRDKKIKAFHLLVDKLEEVLNT